MNSLPRLQDNFCDGRAIDESAIGRTQILEHGSPAIEDDLAMRTGDRRIIYLEIVGETTTQQVGTRLELDLPGAARIRIDDQPGHRLRSSDGRIFNRERRVMSIES